MKSSDNIELMKSIIESNIKVANAKLEAIKYYDSPFVQKEMLQAEITELEKQSDNLKRYGSI